MNITFVQKIVVVIGGSSGIGEATAKAFAKAGGRVYVAGIESRDKVNIDAWNVGVSGSLEYYQLDVTKEEQVSVFADYIEKTTGGCDVLFNNAGILIPNRLHEISKEEWDKTMDVNVTGVFLCAKYFLPQMMKKGGGAIVNTSSMSGLFADCGFASYNASKGAVANLTRNMAIDYAPYHIRVNAVAPGSIKTPMYDSFAEGVGGMDVLDAGTNEVYPMGRIGLPEEIANTVLFLASDKAQFITGHNLVIDGGITAFTGAQHKWDEVRARMQDRKLEKVN